MHFRLLVSELWLLSFLVRNEFSERDRAHEQVARYRLCVMKHSQLDQAIDRQRVEASRRRRFANSHEPNFVATWFAQSKETLEPPYQDVPFGFDRNLCAPFFSQFRNTRQKD